MSSASTSSSTPSVELSALGWDDDWAAALATGNQLFGLADVGRVARVDLGACTVLGPDGSRRALLAPGVAVSVGDWVLIRQGAVAGALPRRTAIVRRAAGVSDRTDSEVPDAGRQRRHRPHPRRCRRSGHPAQRRAVRHAGVGERSDARRRVDQGRSRVGRGTRGGRRPAGTGLRRRCAPLHQRNDWYRARRGGALLRNGPDRGPARLVGAPESPPSPTISPARSWRPAPSGRATTGAGTPRPTGN